MSHTTRRSAIGPAYRGFATLISPTVTLSTKRDWHGVENLAIATGCVVGANHISWADPPILAQFLWKQDRVPRFLGKAEVFKVPVFGQLIKQAGQIPVFREGDAAAAASAAIEAAKKGETVLLFLTRSDKSRSYAIAHSGRGSLPLLTVAGKSYATF